MNEKTTFIQETEPTNFPYNPHGVVWHNPKTNEHLHAALYPTSSGNRVLHWTYGSQTCKCHLFSQTLNVQEAPMAEKKTIFIQDKRPYPYKVGDVWHCPKTDNHYHAVSSIDPCIDCGWTKLGSNCTCHLSERERVVYRQEIVPTIMKIGDIWIKTSTGGHYHAVEGPRPGEVLWEFQRRGCTCVDETHSPKYCDCGGWTCSTHSSWCSNPKDNVKRKKGIEDV